MKTTTSSNSGENKQVEIDFNVKEVKEVKQMDITSIKKVKVPRVPKIKPEKFEMSKAFKSSLEYLKSVGNETIIAMADRILSKKTVTEDGINFVGISSTDSTKISYLDKARSDKYKGEIAPTLFLKEGSVFKYLVKRRISQYWGEPVMYSDPMPKEIVVTKTNLKISPTNNCPPIKITVKTDESNDIVYSPDEEGFYKIEHLMFHFKSLSGNLGEGLKIHKGRGRGYNYEVLHVNEDLGSMEMYGTDYSPKTDLALKPDLINIKRVWDPKIRYESTPGKLLRKLFGTDYTDKELSDFSELFREYGSVGIPGYTFREEVGEKIRENYLEDNYLSGGAGLNSSCMRYDRCQKFFDIYVNNPNARLATLYYNKKVAARALVWTGENETYVDRVYSATTQADGIIKNIVRKYKSVYNTSIEAEVKVNKEFMESLKSAPYMDSFYYYDVEKELLVKNQPKGPHYYMRNQHGNIQKRLNACSCCSSISEDTYGYYIYDTETKCLVPSGQVACHSCLYHVDGINEDWGTGYVLRSQVISVNYGPTTHSRLVIELTDGNTTSKYNRYLREYENNYGYFILYENYDFYESDGLYYHPEDPQNPENIVENTVSTTNMYSTISTITTSSNVSTIFAIEEEDDAN